MLSFLGRTDGISKGGRRRHDIDDLERNLLPLGWKLEIKERAMIDDAYAPSANNGKHRRWHFFANYRAWMIGASWSDDSFSFAFGPFALSYF